MTTERKIPGVVTPMSREDFDAEIKDNIFSSCDLKDVGTFYFVMGDKGELDDSTPEEREVSVNYYNETKQQKHSSSTSVFVTDGVGAKSVALSKNAFLFVEETGGFVVILRKNWASVTFDKFDSDQRTKAVELFSESIVPQTSVQKTGLSKIRSATEGDFILNCDDGESIKVHKSVMVAVWPFFKGMVNSEMKEAAENCVELPMPQSTLEVIVRHLYGQELGLQFDDAARLVVFADMYDLPELLEIAVSLIKKEKLVINQAVYLWQQCFEAKNEDLRRYAAQKLHGLMPNLATFQDDIEGLEKVELVCLLQDLCLVMAVGK